MATLSGPRARLPPCPHQAGSFFCFSQGITVLAPHVDSETQAPQLMHGISGVTND